MAAWGYEFCHLELVKVTTKVNLSKFLKDNKIARVRRASAIISL